MSDAVTITPVNKKMRGAKPTPRHKLQAAHPHTMSIKAAPAQFAIVPKELSMWDNDVDGDCVTAEEAYAMAVFSIMCGMSEIFVPDAEVIRWAKQYGFLNGATLTDVMDQMAKDGFNVNGTNYKDGPYNGVDYSNEPLLQNAIATGPVKLGIDANALPSTAGDAQGWFAVTGTPEQFTNEDHCVGLSGYGTAGYLYEQLGVPLPTGLPASTPGYLLFTWSTIGFVTHAWIMSTVAEAWVRNPTKLGMTPTPPTPPTPPTTQFTLSAGATSGVAPLTVDFTVVNVPTGTSPMLDPGDGSAPLSIPTSYPVTYTYQTPGVYTATATAGTETSTMQVVVTAVPPPVVTPPTYDVTLTGEIPVGWGRTQSVTLTGQAVPSTSGTPNDVPSFGCVASKQKGASVPTQSSVTSFLMSNGMSASRAFVIAQTAFAFQGTGDLWGAWQAIHKHLALEMLINPGAINPTNLQIILAFLLQILPLILPLIVPPAANVMEASWKVFDTKSRNTPPRN